MKWILNKVKAYVDRKYNGNLINLVNCAKSPSCKIGPLLNTKKYKNICNYVSKLPLKLYKDFYDWYSSRKIQNNIYIDNNKPDGFINFFKGNNCLLSCEECNYCEKWAKDAINADQVQIDILSKLLNKLTFSKCF